MLSVLKLCATEDKKSVWDRSAGKKRKYLMAPPRFCLFSVEVLLISDENYISPNKDQPISRPICGKAICEGPNEWGENGRFKKEKKKIHIYIHTVYLIDLI